MYAPSSSSLRACRPKSFRLILKERKCGTGEHIKKTATSNQREMAVRWRRTPIMMDIVIGV